MLSKVEGYALILVVTEDLKSTQGYHIGIVHYERNEKGEIVGIASVEKPVILWQPTLKMLLAMLIYCNKLFEEGFGEVVVVDYKTGKVLGYTPIDKALENDTMFEENWSKYMEGYTGEPKDEPTP